MVKYSSDDGRQWGLILLHTAASCRHPHPRAVNVDFSPDLLSLTLHGTWHKLFGKWFWSYCHQLSCQFEALQSAAVTQINIDICQHPQRRDHI